MDSKEKELIKDKIIGVLKVYLTFESLDGRPVRKDLRKEMKELLVKLRVDELKNNL